MKAIGGNKLFEMPPADAKTEPAAEKPKKRIDLDKGIEELVGAICDPIIAFPSAWIDSIPEALKSQIKLDRLIMCMRYSKGEEVTATDSEALAYMFPRTLESPLDHDWVEIYLYLGNQYAKSKGTEIPEDIKKEQLSEYLMYKLDDLKSFIYRARVRQRTEKASKFKKDRKEAKAAEKEQMQPKFF